MYQYFKRQLKTLTCFGSFGIHPQGVLKRDSLKLLEMFCVRSRCLAAGEPCGAVQRTAPQGSPRTPATCIAATTPGLIVRILKFWF